MAAELEATEIKARIRMLRCMQELIRIQHARLQHLLSDKTAAQTMLYWGEADGRQQKG